MWHAEWNKHMSADLWLTPDVIGQSLSLQKLTWQSLPLDILLYDFGTNTYLFSQNINLPASDAAGQHQWSKLFVFWPSFAGVRAPFTRTRTLLRLRLQREPIPRIIVSWVAHSLITNDLWLIHSPTTIALKCCFATLARSLSIHQRFAIVRFLHLAVARNSLASLHNANQSSPLLRYELMALEVSALIFKSSSDVTRFHAHFLICDLFAFFIFLIALRWLFNKLLEFIMLLCCFWFLFLSVSHAKWPLRIKFGTNCKRVLPLHNEVSWILAVNVRSAEINWWFP